MTATPAAALPVDRAATVKRAPLPALLSWVLFDWAVQPFYTLVITFLFAPYFANIVAGDKAWGSALWGYALAVAGVFIAFGSPLLGAMADGRGRRKPWILLFSLIYVASVSTLWFATPAAPPWLLYAMLAAFAVALVAAEYTAVFTNAIMPGLVPNGELGRLSGTSWAMGYFGGLAALMLVLGFLVPAPGSNLTLIHVVPLLSLDEALREGDRLSGPVSAVWYAVFMIPFFLFVPDIRAAKRPAGERTATGELWDTLRTLPKHPDILLFLIARMSYSDGLSAIFTFGGIYGAGVFGWDVMELGIFGIILALVGGIGALTGGLLDDRLGPKAVIIGALFLMLVGAAGILSVDKGHIFYVLEVQGKAPGSMPFSALGEQVFLAFAILIATVSAPVQAASRSLMARLAPPDKVTQFFGLFAFSGKATAFLAPFLVAAITAATGEQRLGMASIALFLLAGMVLIAPVRTPRPNGF